jgi:hypothetical protein
MRELYHAYLYTADFENLSSTHLQTGGTAPALRGDVGALLESALDFNGCNASTIDDAKILALWIKMKNQMIGFGVWRNGTSAMSKAITAAEKKGFITSLQAKNCRDLNYESNVVRHQNTEEREYQ